VFKTCGERYYDRKAKRYLEEIKVINEPRALTPQFDEEFMKKSREEV
jgi:hypothetical protein